MLLIYFTTDLVDKLPKICKLCFNFSLVKFIMSKYFN